MVLAVSLPRSRQHSTLRVELRLQGLSVYAAATARRIDLPAQRDHVRVILVVRGQAAGIFSFEFTNVVGLRIGLGLLELLRQKNPFTLQRIDLQLGAVKIAISTIHDVQIDLPLLGQAASILGLEQRQFLFEARDAAPEPIRFSAKKPCRT